MDVAVGHERHGAPRRPLVPLLAVTLALLVLAGCTPGSPAPAATPARVIPSGTQVDPALFGTHVGGIASGTQPLPPRAGAVRLWDAGVSWRQLEPTRGHVRWELLDRAVSQAEATGAREILWVHGSPPPWAAEDPQSPGLYGPGTSSHPKTAAYLRILREIATRYRGRITSYQVWNEANIRIFYRGTAARMAELTARAQKVLREADPTATLVGASTTMRRSGPVKPWYGRYAKALAKLGWPVDAMAVHLYPIADQGAGTRAAYTRMIKPWLAKRGWTGPVWDTEINYGDRRDFASQIVVVPRARAAAWVARTYIDSLALGVSRVFWYSWNDHLLGIDQIDPQTGATLPAGQAYLTVQQWFADAWWQGCTGELMEPTGEAGALTTCSVQYGTGQRARILFSHGGATTVAMPTGASEVCPLDGTCSAVTGDRLAVGTAPQLVRLAG
jgi:hypothetical protein